MTTKLLEGTVLAAITVLCWSSYNVAAKHGIDNGFSPEALTFLRFTLPGAVAIPILIFFSLQGRRVGIPIFRLLVLVLLGGPLFGWVAVSGYNHAPLSHGLLFAPVAVFVMGCCLGRLLLREHISTRRLVGASVMFIGLATLVGFEVQNLSETWFWGVSLFVLAGAMWGSYTVLLRLWGIPMIEGTLAVATGSALVAVPFLGISASENLMTVPTASLVLQLVMQGIIGGIVSVAVLIGAVRVLPAQTASLLPAFTPVVALAIAAAVLSQMPSMAELIGVVVICSGFVMSLKNQASQSD